MLALKFITPMAGALGSVHTQPGLRTALTRILVNRDRFAALSTPPSSSESQQQHADAAVTSNDIRDFVLAILGSMLDADAGAAEPIATAAVACGKRSCAVACTCGGERLATTLARMYADAAGSSADAFAAYVAGYLAFLVSRLVELYPSARVLVEPHLPGNGWRAQIEGLLAEVTELLTLRNSAHSKLRAIVEAGEAGEEGEEGERDRVRANTPGAEDNEKLNEAIAFLRGEIEKTQ